METVSEDLRTRQRPTLKPLLGVLVPYKVTENAKRFNGYYGDFGNNNPRHAGDLLETMRDAKFNWNMMDANQELDRLEHTEALHIIERAINELEEWIEVTGK